MTLTSPPKRKIEELSVNANLQRPTSSSTTKPSQTLTTSTKTTTRSNNASHLPSPSDTGSSESSDSSEDSSDDASAERSSNEEDEDEDEDEYETAQPSPPPIPLRNRLAAFLPQLAAANESLLSAPPGPGRDSGFEILESRDTVAKPRNQEQDAHMDEGEEESADGEAEQAGPYIEMDLDLGILEEKREKKRRPVKDGIVLPLGKDDGGSSGDESEKDEEVDEEVIGGMSGDQPSQGVLHKLKGGTADIKQKKVVIEEVT